MRTRTPVGVKRRQIQLDRLDRVQVGLHPRRLRVDVSGQRQRELDEVVALRGVGQVSASVLDEQANARLVVHVAGEVLPAGQQAGHRGIDLHRVDAGRTVLLGPARRWHLRQRRERARGRGGEHDKATT